jgi:hypothetical protein
MTGRKEREKGKRDSRRRSRQAVRKKRKRAVGEKEKMDTTNGIRCWKSGVRDREKIFGIQGSGF